MMSPGKLLDIRVATLFRSFSIYFVGRALGYAGPILLLPILTRVLTTRDFGIVATFTALYQVSNIIISLSGTGAVVRAYMDRHENEFHYPRYIFNALFVNSILFLLMPVPFYIIVYFKIIEVPMLLIFMVPIVVLLSNVRAYKTKLWNIQEKPVAFTVVNSTFAIGGLVFSIILVSTILPNWQGRIFSILAIEILFFLICLYYLFKEDGLELKLDKEYIQDILKFGIPLVPHSIGLTVLGSADRILLNNFYGLSDVGIYAVAASISGLVLLVAMPLDLVSNPYIFKILKEYNDIGKKRYIAGFYVYSFIVITTGIGLYVCAPVIIDLFIGASFNNAKQYVGILIFGQVAHAMYRYVVRAIFYSKKTKYVSFSTVGAGVLGIVCQLALVNRFGISGVAVGTSIAYIASFALSFYFSNRLYPMPWKESLNILKRIDNVFNEVAMNKNP